jgi:hypothetical protein
MKNYAAQQVNEVIESNEGSNYMLRMLISSDTVSTKYLNITQEQAKQIRDILASDE